jgi:pyridinium-3,5-bisthiocarboxylic acid mononucleotide nickel chelatase
MRILYIDCFSGISGDMMVGALTDLGVNPSAFEWELSKLDLEDHHLHFEKQNRKGITGIQFGVHAGATHVEEQDHHDHHHHESHHHKRDQSATHSHEHSHDFNHTHDHHHHDHQTAREVHGRGFAEIRGLIEKSDLSAFVKTHSTNIFRRIAEAEAKIHGTTVDDVHFHEVGALDSIVDIVLTCVGIEALGIQQIHFSNLVEGHGTLRIAHGDYPVPVPATLEILKGLPIRQIPVPHELITPTGAAIVAEFQSSIGLMPELLPDKIGYGLGTRDHENRPNVLRAILGELHSSAHAKNAPEPVIEIQANIDDQSAELLAACQDRLLDAGALDVFLTPVQMKKGRPGTLLTLLCRPNQQTEFLHILFAETTTFGVRFKKVDRLILDRDFEEVETGHGKVRVKIGRLNGELIQVSPEFEDCQTLSRQTGIPLKRIYEEASIAYWENHP